ncbi:hypothetical protein F5Y08DRAFT_125754 [Xylaria arbuscula]|uniref:Uncharacterized protein n=1 Tax=Xylaria arbuscula TaxID=114810 RepID=A0A9W8TJQ8_9PEZI|nr:hypothetical protein F5Y08DRAFT_125754 [Xylaria arbuscula]KAJ3561599.1 hypothetical protein NPX13_g8883 [Xylaria arbuscula]
MGIFRKLGLALLVPLIFFAFRTAYNQWMLVSLTYVVDPLAPDDMIFDSELYTTLFNHTKWATVDTFAVGVGMPFHAVPRELWDEDKFGAEVMKQLWDQRLVTQFNRQPTNKLPKMGDGSINDAFAAQVVSVGEKDMSVALVSRPKQNQLPLGFEHIMVTFDRDNKVAVAMIRYIWHTRKETPPSWRKSLARWTQMNGRRQWLLHTANAIAEQKKTKPAKLEL